MLRKLIVLAISSAIAKKAWDAYKDKERHAAASSPRTSGTLTPRQPRKDPAFVETRPGAN